MSTIARKPKGQSCTTRLLISVRRRESRRADKAQGPGIRGVLDFLALTNFNSPFPGSESRLKHAHAATERRRSVQ
jgi:hypothetical protein